VPEVRLASTAFDLVADSRSDDVLNVTARAIQRDTPSDAVVPQVDQRLPGSREHEKQHAPHRTTCQLLLAVLLCLSMVKKRAPLKVQINVRFTEATAAVLEKRAAVERRSVSDVVRIIVCQTLENEKPSL